MEISQDIHSLIRLGNHSEAWDHFADRSKSKDSDRIFQFFMGISASAS